jgi:hypothetical protein
MANYVSVNGLETLHTVFLSILDFTFHIKVTTPTPRLDVLDSSDPPKTLIKDVEFPPYYLGGPLEVTLSALSRSIVMQKTVTKATSELYDRFQDVRHRFYDLGLMNTISLAPVRTKPRRTFDQIIEQFSPEGEHTPFVLQSIIENSSLRATLEEFGQEAELFDNILIRRLDRTQRGPIQLQIKRKGKPRNIVDVGYGVSQVLPLVVEALTAQRRTRLLIQQPEVHLHPKAQAALGSLFAKLARPQLSFLIETHSDYILDRIRIEIANNMIKHTDVQLLFVQRLSNESKVHPIRFDSKGNVLDPPQFYREFFLRESARLFKR